MCDKCRLQTDWRLQTEKLYILQKKKFYLSFLLIVKLMNIFLNYKDISSENL